MVLNKFRHISDKLTKKPVDWFVKHHITPNQLSITGFVISIIAAVGYAFPKTFIYNWRLAWLPVALFFFSGWFDVVDGGVARKSGKVSKFGGFLDSTLDRLADAIIVFGLMTGNMLWPWDKTINDIIGYSAISVMIMISYTRSRAENEGVVMKGVGFMERAERVFIIMGGYIAESVIYFGTVTIPNDLNTQPLFNYNVHWFFPIFFIVFTLLCIQTLLARIIHTYKWLSGKISRKYLERHNLLEVYPFKDQVEDVKLNNIEKISS